MLFYAQAPTITSEIRILFLNAQFCKSYNKNKKEVNASDIFLESQL